VWAATTVGPSGMSRVHSDFVARFEHPYTPLLFEHMIDK